MAELEDIVGTISNFWGKWEDGVYYIHVSINTENKKQNLVKFYCDGKGTENLLYGLLESIKGRFKVSAQIEKILDENNRIYLGNTLSILD